LLLDPEIIVKEAAASCLTQTILSNSIKIEPYLPDILSIISHLISNSNFPAVVDNANLYLNNFSIFCEIFNLLCDHYANCIKNEAISAPLIRLISENFKEIVSLYLQKSKDEGVIHKILCDYLDILFTLQKAAGSGLAYCAEFLLENSLKILYKNLELHMNTIKEVYVVDKDLISKCFDLLTQIYLQIPIYMAVYGQKDFIADFAFKFLFEINDAFINISIVSLIGSIAKSDKFIFKEDILKLFINRLIEYLDLPENCLNKGKCDDTDETTKLSLFRSSCDALPSLAISYNNEIIKESLDHTMKKLLKILSFPRVNF
jgi:hypothetical protein